MTHSLFFTDGQVSTDHSKLKYNGVLTIASESSIRKLFAPEVSITRNIRGSALTKSYRKRTRSINRIRKNKHSAR